MKLLLLLVVFGRSIVAAPNAVRLPQTRGIEPGPSLKPIDLPCNTPMHLAATKHHPSVKLIATRAQFLLGFTSHLTSI
jgi:hypothetical protein